MKNSLLSFCFLNLISCIGVSQVFPKNENGEIMYVEVVKADSIEKEDMFRNAVRWIQLLSQESEEINIAKRDSLGGNLSGQSSFFVYAQSGIFRKISGKINYTISIDIKDNKYRYYFSHFVFHYYQENRNYTMVASHKTKPLEDETAGGWQKLWTKHRNTVNVKMLENINTLKRTITEKEKEQVITKNPAEKSVEW